MSDLKDVFSKNTYVENAAEVNFEEFEKVITSRRSVRRFTDKNIPEDVVRKCLDMALLAPNSSNLQPWEFHWVRSSKVRKKIDQAFLSQPAATTADTIIVAVARTATWKIHAKKMVDLIKAQDPKHSALSYYEKIVPLVYTIGFLGLAGLLKKTFLSVIGFRKPVPREPTSKAELITWAVKSTALACQNLMLAFRAAGYDSCPMEGMDSSRLKKLLKLPSDAVVVMGISAGQRAEDGVFGKQIRFDKKLFIHEI